MTKTLLSNLLKYLAAAALLGWVVWSNWAPGLDSTGKPRQGLKDVWERHVVQGEPIHTGFFVLAFAAFTLSAAITFIRWYVLVRAQGLPFTIPEAVRLGMVGLFFNTFLPGSVGGDLIKAVVLARQQNRRTVAVATVVMDRVIALWALIWFVAMLGGTFWLLGLLEGRGGDTSQFVVTVAAATVVVTVVIWCLLGLLSQERADRLATSLEGMPRVGPSLAELWRAFWMYRCRTRHIVGALLLSWVAQVGFVLTFYCSVRTLWDPVAGDPIPTLAQHFLIVPIGLVILAIPLFPGGAGIGELGLGKLYEWFGCAMTAGVLGMLVQRVIMWALGLICGVVYERMRSRLPTTEKNANELAAA